MAGLVLGKEDGCVEADFNNQKWVNSVNVEICKLTLFEIHKIYKRVYWSRPKVFAKCWSYFPQNVIQLQGPIEFYQEVVSCLFRKKSGKIDIDSKRLAKVFLSCWQLCWQIDIIRQFISMFINVHCLFKHEYSVQIIVCVMCVIHISTKVSKVSFNGQIRSSLRRPVSRRRTSTWSWAATSPSPRCISVGAFSGCRFAADFLDWLLI